MQKTLRKALLHSVTVLVLCMLCLAMALGGLLTSPVVYADTVIGDVQMDCSDVMEDLESSTIDGKPFDISDYAFDESEQTQVVMFAEYCYSFYANRQENYGLYVYVWNPQGLRFTLDSTRNKISLRTGKDESVGYTKYTLLYLDQCDQTNYEGLFLKFKVMLSGEEKEQIFESLKSDERVYSARVQHRRDRTAHGRRSECDGIGSEHCLYVQRLCKGLRERRRRGKHVDLHAGEGGRPDAGRAFHSVPHGRFQRGKPVHGGQLAQRLLCGPE